MTPGEGAGKTVVGGEDEAPSVPGAQWSHVAGHGTCLRPAISPVLSRVGYGAQWGLSPQGLPGDSEKALLPTSPLLCAAGCGARHRGRGAHGTEPRPGLP